MAVTIQNVVSTADLNQRVDATRFAKFRWGVYDQVYYGGLCGYIKDDLILGRVTVFFSGKMISVGAKSIVQSIDQLDHARDLLVKESLVKRVELRPLVRNIVATTNMGGRLDLNKIALHLQKTIFEPDIFPGIIYKLVENTTCLIFSTGKIVIAGARDEKQLHYAATYLSKTLEPYIIQ